MPQIPKAEIIADLKKQYRDKRIKCVNMIDKNAVPPGTLGTCWEVDGIGNLLMNWDNGSNLNLLPGFDEFEVIGGE